VQVAAAVIVVQIAFNFAPVLAQRFPAEITRELGQYYRDGFDKADTLGKCGAPPAPIKSAVVLVNAGFLYPYCYLPEPAGRIIFQTPHPQQYQPYVFESLGPQQRDLVRRADISIRLVQRQ
jgi:hypothetical protein